MERRTRFHWSSELFPPRLTNLGVAAESSCGPTPNLAEDFRVLLTLVPPGNTERCLDHITEDEDSSQVADPKVVQRGDIIVQG